MNPPPFWLRSTIFMDLLGESPIGAWATFNDCLFCRRSSDVTVRVDVDSSRSELFPLGRRTVARSSRLSGGRDAEMRWKGCPSRNQAISGVPEEGVLTSCFL